MNQKQQEIIQQAIINEVKYQRRTGFRLGVILGILVGFGIGAVVMYDSIDQVVVVSVGLKTEV